VSTPALVVRNLHYRYPDGRHALRGVSFEVGEGATVAIVGPNGAGKSTLLWHLNGLLPGRVRGPSGHHGVATQNAHVAAVWVDGIEVNEKNGNEVRKRVGLLFQDPDDQLFSPTVIEDVAFGPLNLGLSRHEARRLALECLRQVELADVADRPPHHLSYGERKRACLAGLLACSPRMLVFDEPTANLDPRARRRFVSLLRGLSATKVIATHDLELVVEMCEQTIVMDHGQVVAHGPTFEILQDSALLEAHGLEKPLSLELRAMGKA
jgi:energy-coupling factor transporter ATP-binding protein EcfA2